MGGFVVGGEEEKGSPAPGPHPESPALISLGVQWVWESEPPSPPGFHRSHPALLKHKTHSHVSADATEGF